MKLYCRGEYHCFPRDLHFLAPGEIDVNDDQAEFLLRDAPENFTRLPPSGGQARDVPPVESKALDKPPLDKMVKKPTRKKSAG